VSLAILAALRVLGGWLKAVPWQAWVALAVLLLGWRYGDLRANQRELEVRAEYVAAQAEADRKFAAQARRLADASRRIADDTVRMASTASTDTRTETASAVEKVRYVTRQIVVPAGCPVGLPDGVRNEGREAVERARAAGGAVRAGGDPAR
jgi:uncharacterized membrane protein